MKTRWKNAKCKDKFPFTKPMIWSAPRNEGNCYFCITDITGFTSTTKSKIEYANVDSIVKPAKILVVDVPGTSKQMNVEEEEMLVDEVFQKDSPEDKDEEYLSEDEEYLPEYEDGDKEYLPEDETKT
ncbi:unnamed protein product [Psylliodes chrysocephalus]|uniref:Uncharacterized protein n=1 Tax=Psylliodes chrysocephalus TaxID=3402493 RepID=A0A9P0CE03_9CUCU|nr:unnamed protein product [Psylliodes chrysocephala]